MLNRLNIRKILIRVLGRIAIIVFDTVLFTCKVEKVGEKDVAPFLKGGAYLLASWHGRLITYFFGPRKNWPAAMASRSRDGEIAASIQENGRYVVFRGSTRKGGAEALVQMERYMRKHRRSGMMSVDGPTGPIFVAKPGAANLASALRYPIIPVSFSAKNVLIMRSWDRLMIPKPFTPFTLIYGKPIHVKANASKADIDRATRKLENELRRITELADAHYGHRIK